MARRARLDTKRYNTKRHDMTHTTRHVTTDLMTSRSHFSPNSARTDPCLKGTDVARSTQWTELLSLLRTCWERIHAALFCYTCEDTDLRVQRTALYEWSTNQRTAGNAKWYCELERTAYKAFTPVTQRTVLCCVTFFNRFLVSKSDGVPHFWSIFGGSLVPT